MLESSLVLGWLSGSGDESGVATRTRYTMSVRDDADTERRGGVTISGRPPKVVPSGLSPPEAPAGLSTAAKGAGDRTGLWRPLLRDEAEAERRIVLRVCDLLRPPRAGLDLTECGGGGKARSLAGVLDESEGDPSGCRDGSDNKRDRGCRPRS